MRHTTAPREGARGPPSTAGLFVCGEVSHLTIDHRGERRRVSPRKRSGRRVSGRVAYLRLKLPVVLP